MPRGDGRLTHDLLPGEKGPQDACGVFGVWAPGEEVAKLTYFGLYALQHRGQESAGIAVSDGRQILVYKDMGLVVAGLRRGLAREPCTATSPSATAATPPPASSVWENAQPTFRATATGHVALGHNGNLTNTHELARLVERAARRARRAAARHRRVGSHQRHRPAHRAARRAPRPLARGRGAGGAAAAARARSAWSSWTTTTLYAARDPQGIRPLVLGRLERGWVVASRDRGPRHRRRVVRPRGRARRADRHRRARPALAAASPRPTPRAASSSSSTSPAPTPRSPAAASTPCASRSAAGSRASTRSTPTWSSRCPSRGTPAADRLRAGVGHPVRPGPGEERLRRAHVHPAVADHPPARHPAQAQPAARGHRTASGSSSSTTRSCAATPSAPWCGCCARPAPREVHVRISQPAGEVAVLLRHRLRHPRRAHRQRPRGRRDPHVDRRRLARLRLARGARRGHDASRWTGSAAPASTASTRSSCPSPSCSASTCSRASSGRGRVDADDAPQPTLDVDGLPTLLGGGGAADALDRP